MMIDFNRNIFFELMQEALIDMEEICSDHNVPNFECYSREIDEIEDEDVRRVIEALKDVSDIVKRNI